jgi:hypothetical protein
VPKRNAVRRGDGTARVFNANLTVMRQLASSLELAEGVKSVFIEKKGKP